MLYPSSVHYFYCVGLYCFSSQVDLHSSTSRLYISTTSSMSVYSHLMCVINSLYSVLLLALAFVLTLAVVELFQSRFFFVEMVS